MRKFIALLAAVHAVPVAAQSFSGPAIAIDGDTLEMGGERLRLFGIDAPESTQTCERGGAAWACGKDAGALLSEMIAGNSVTCTARDRDAYGRIVAICKVGSSDLSAILAREGFAVPLPQFSTDYVDLAARAKQFGLAIWGSQFQTPADFRQANPSLFAAPPADRPMTSRASRSRPAAAQSGWSYRNCREARAAGAAPLRRGHPGYGAHMDGDGDGVACEPYRG